MVVLQDQFHLFKRKKVALLALAVLVVLTATAWLLWPKQSQPASPPISSLTFQQELSIVTNEAQLGNTSKAIAQINSYQAQNLTTAEKVGFLEERAVIYTNEGNTAQAFAAYKQSEALQGSKLDSATAQGLMYIYAKQGNTTKAALYCQKLNAASQAVNDPLAQANLPTCSQPQGNSQ